MAIKIFVFIFTVSITLNVYSQNTEWIWAKSAGGTDIDGSLSLDIDANNNVFIGGSFSSNQINIGGFTLQNSKIGGGTSDIFIAKYDPSGNVLWAKSAGGGTGSSTWDYGRDITVDTDGNVYLTGWFESDTVVFGSTVLTHDPIGNVDIFVVKYDENGNVLWAKTSRGGNNANWSNSVTSLSNGICLSGYFAGDTIIFDNDTLYNNGYRDIFLVKYDTSGNVMWAKSAGETGTFSDDEGNYVSADSDDNLYVTGFFTGTAITFGSNNLTNNGVNTQDFFIVKYDDLGNVAWAKSAGGINDDFGKSISSSESGNTYATGLYKSSTVAFDSFILSNTTINNKSDIFVAKYDNSGNVMWAKSAGGISDDGVWSINTDADENVYVTGWFGSEISFGNITLTNNQTDGSFDIFIAKYNSTGNVLWALKVGGSGNDYGRGAKSDENGNLYVTGGFNSPVINFDNTILTNTNNSGNTSDIFLSKLDMNTGIEDFAIDDIVNIYPNPSNTKIKISAETGIDSYSIYDIHGSVISQKIVNHEKSIETNISALVPGLYYFSIVTEKGISIKKIIKH